MAIFGGVRNFSHVSDELWLFNITAAAWASPVRTAMWPQARFGHVSGIWGAALFVTGGLADTGGTPLPLDVVYSYTLATNAWTPLTATGPAPSARAFVAFSVYMGTQYLLVGGWDGQDGATPLSDMYVLDAPTTLQPAPAWTVQDNFVWLNFTAFPAAAQLCPLSPDTLMLWGGTFYPSLCCE
jgi:hypothetical protein